jgi:hypothetical protein
LLLQKGMLRKGSLLFTHIFFFLNGPSTAVARFQSVI